MKLGVLKTESMYYETVLQVILGHLTYRTTHRPTQRPVCVQSAGCLGPPEEEEEEVEMIPGKIKAVWVGEEGLETWLRGSSTGCVSMRTRACILAPRLADWTINSGKLAVSALQRWSDRHV